jgi:hypothetical protein
MMLCFSCFVFITFCWSFHESEQLFREITFQGRGLNQNQKSTPIEKKNIDPI